MTPRERLIVAVDVPKADAASELVDRLAGRVGLFKLGSQAFTAAGPELVREVVGRGERVFLDLKFHDIPNTVAGAVASAAQLGVSLATVHGLGGRAMLEAAVGALPALGTKLLAITILTSHDEATLGEIGVGGGVSDSVRRLALLAKDAGMDGVVASPHEVALVREACGPGFLIVTPGIRPAGAASGDQARAATPAAALSAGADYLVVGRPITEAKDPGAAADHAQIYGLAYRESLDAVQRMVSRYLWVIGVFMLSIIVILNTRITSSFTEESQDAFKWLMWVLLAVAVGVCLFGFSRYQAFRDLAVATHQGLQTLASTTGNLALLAAARESLLGLRNQGPVQFIQMTLESGSLGLMFFSYAMQIVLAKVTHRSVLGMIFPSPVARFLDSFMLGSDTPKA
jgi:orotidine-5'-phosphate decarboxylase